MESSLSVIDLVRHADPVVQAIVLGLALCSVACWAIIIEKLIRLTSLRRQISALEQLAAHGGRGAGQLPGVAGAVMSAARSEQADLAAGPAPPYEARSRIEETMRAAMLIELRRLEGGLPFLATISSAAPFIGLFGTVWGIMTSFASIAQSQDTSLEVVAPGIAEALFATAAGLAVAIPAVIAFNQISAVLGRAAQSGGAAIPPIARALAREGAKSFAEID
ncbi:MotA/TolQ/ExbB proton channel family protein [Mesorhizobium sp. KR2-14]|uniref:MotA/TolQ/ExbB proton channel family protein n=1 Tax=Mesorhizobium sp. KR2-14 TaxID=3156610 RepID=UPI0032B41428